MNLRPQLTCRMVDKKINRYLDGKKKTRKVDFQLNSKIEHL